MRQKSVIEVTKQYKLIKMVIEGKDYAPCSRWQRIKNLEGKYGYPFLWLKHTRIWFHKFEPITPYVTPQFTERVFLSEDYPDLALQFMQGKFRLLKHLKKNEGSKFL